MKQFDNLHKEKYLISVIVPTYNVSLYIHDFFKSILGIFNCIWSD